MRSFFKCRVVAQAAWHCHCLLRCWGSPSLCLRGSKPPGGNERAAHVLSQARGRGSTDSPFGEQDSVFAEKQLKALNEARQKALVSDTKKLLKLTQELNAEISSSAPSSLTSQQLRKLASIEKLAHNVKEKMSESYVSPSLMHDPLQPLRRVGQQIYPVTPGTVTVCLWVWNSTIPAW